jgi:predicted nucleic acid-binding protein
LTSYGRIGSSGVRRCYFDTSAVAKLIRVEAYSADVARWAHDPHVTPLSSLLVETELRRSAMRWGVAQEAATQTLEHFELFGIPDWEFKAAGLIPAPGLRALDAIHVAAAIRLEADAIITYDERMIEAAAAMGLPVIQPGVEGHDGVTRTASD